MIKVLITDISSYKAIVCAKALSNNPEITIITADFRKISKSIRTKYSKNHYLYANHKISEQGFVKDIIEIIKKEKIDLIIPINSKDIRILLNVKNKLFGTLDYIGDYETFIKLDNKEKLAELSDTLNLKVPITFKKVEEISSFPVVFKPTESSSSKGVKYFYSKIEIEDYLKINPFKNFVIQQFIVGEGVGYSVLAKQGKILYSCGHKRIAEYPVAGGSSTIRAYFEHKDMTNISKQIIEKTNWSGLAMFEFKHTQSNEIYLIEINPRVWGSINQSIQSGVNFPLLIANHKLDKTISICYNKEAKTLLSPLYLFSLVGYLFIGKLSPIKYYLKHIFSIKPDISILNDPKGFLAQLLVIIR